MASFHNPAIRPPKDIDSLPTISIVTPCFNHVEYVEAAMHSVLSQDYPKLEYVVMDGGSDDGSVEVIERYAEHLTHWQSQPDGGQYAAINAGFEHTSGEIMAWINSDDMYHRNAFWTVADVFRTFEDVEWLCGAVTTYDRWGRTMSAGPPQKWSRFRYLSNNLDLGFPQQESMFWRRGLWDRAGGKLDESLRLAADFELWMRFFRHARLFQVRGLVGGFRFVPGQRSVSERDGYYAEASEVIARETISPADRRIMRKLRLYERFLRRVPGLRSHRSLRRRFRRLYDPCMIQYDPVKDRFKRKG